MKGSAPPPPAAAVKSAKAAPPPPPAAPVAVKAKAAPTGGMLSGLTGARPLKRVGGASAAAPVRSKGPTEDDPVLTVDQLIQRIPEQFRKGFQPRIQEFRRMIQEEEVELQQLMIPGLPFEFKQVHLWFDPAVLMPWAEKRIANNGWFYFHTNLLADVQLFRRTYLRLILDDPLGERTSMAYAYWTSGIIRVIPHDNCVLDWQHAGRRRVRSTCHFVNGDIVIAHGDEPGYTGYFEELFSLLEPGARRSNEQPFLIHWPFTTPRDQCIDCGATGRAATLCASCNGTGTHHDHTSAVCAKCKGVWRCKTCNGTGSIPCESKEEALYPNGKNTLRHEVNYVENFNETN